MAANTNRKSFENKSSQTVEIKVSFEYIQRVIRHLNQYFRSLFKSFSQLLFKLLKQFNFVYLRFYLLVIPSPCFHVFSTVGG